MHISSVKHTQFLSKHLPIIVFRWTGFHSRLAGRNRPLRRRKRRRWHGSCPCSWRQINSCPWTDALPPGMPRLKGPALVAWLRARLGWGKGGVEDVPDRWRRRRRRRNITTFFSGIRQNCLLNSTTLFRRSVMPYYPSVCPV
jgi:hypothetical protein